MLLLTYNLMPQKGFAIVWIILILVLVAVLGTYLFLNRSIKSLQSVNPVNKDSTQAEQFIISNPVDLSQIKKI